MIRHRRAKEEAVRLCLRNGGGTEVDAAQGQQTARRPVGIGAQQIAAALQQANLLPFAPVAAIGKLEPGKRHQVENPVWGDIDRGGRGELVFERSKQLLVQHRSRSVIEPRPRQTQRGDRAEIGHHRLIEARQQQGREPSLAHLSGAEVNLPELTELDQHGPCRQRRSHIVEIGGLHPQMILVVAADGAERLLPGLQRLECLVEHIRFSPHGAG
jgi:hypothetical protein